MDGLHLIADLHQCAPPDARVMTDTAVLRAACLQAVQAAGLTGVGELFHAFAPGSGITGVVLLAESHCTVHTWPELHSATLDVYVCNYGQDNSDKARLLLDGLMRLFGSALPRLQEVRRG